MECLTAQRVRICQVIRNTRLSVSALVEELGRNRGSVWRDVQTLKELGLLRLREQVNPGHGVVQIVEPVAGRVQRRVEFQVRVDRRVGRAVCHGKTECERGTTRLGWLP